MDFSVRVLTHTLLLSMFGLPGHCRQIPSVRSFGSLVAHAGYAPPDCECIRILF